MIIERLGLRNFGIYGGHHKFDLGPDEEGGKPIVLIEGHNGAGKTTFLEAIRLALYGKAALGNRVSQKAYEIHLNDRLHRGDSENTMEIGLDLRRHEKGEQHSYVIRRQWIVRDSGIEEQLTVLVDGDRRDDVSVEEWQDVLNDMIPPGVSQLFFFDGEKIQEIAQGDASTGLQQAIRPLLGLDIIEQLRSDLALFVARQKSGKGADDLQAASRDLKASECELTLAEEKRAQIASERDQANARLHRAEAAFRKEGGMSATDGAGAKQDRKRVEERQQALLSDLREIAAGFGPLILAPVTLRRLQDEAAEAELHQAKMAAMGLVEEFEEQEPNQSGRPPAMWEQFRQFINAETKTLPRWTQSGAGALRRRMAEVEMFDRGRCRELAECLDQNLIDAQAADDQIEAFVKGVGDVSLDAIRKAEFERGRLSAALEEQDGLVARLRSRRDRESARLERLQDQVFVEARLGRSAALAGRARTALVDYEERVLEGRITALEEYFLACLHKLLRRPTMVGQVKLDPESFDILLIGGEGEVIAIDSMSAGERQLFAVALLWALAKTSERALPLVIDTPLGRLDRLHRERIIGQYLAGASEQVILLCTDTELTAEVAAQLEPFVSRHLKLGVGERDVTTGVTLMNEPVVEARAYATL